MQGDHRENGPRLIDPAAGTGQWPAQLEDMGMPVEFLHDNGGTYNYGASQMAAFGESAGAHLALMAGLKFAGDPGDPDRNLDSVVSWYGISDLENVDNDRAAAGFPEFNAGAGSPESLLVGAYVEDNPAAAAAASPLYMLGEVADDLAMPSFC